MRWFVSPWRWLRDRRDCRRYLERRAREYPGEQLAVEAAMFLEDPNPAVIPWPRVVEVSPRPKPARPPGY